MRILRVYLDTSVFGGCCDRAFERDSLRVVNAVGAGNLKALVSELSLRELTEAPEAVRALLSALPPQHFERWDVSDEALALRDAYLDAGVVGAR